MPTQPSPPGAAHRLEGSLALRLAVLYSLVFAVGAAALIGAFVWTASVALETPARTDVERRAEDLARAYERGGVSGLVSAQRREDTSSATYFVRVVGPNNATEWLFAPSDWVETEIARIPFPAGVLTKQIQTVTVPKNAEREYVIAERQLENAFKLQVGRSTETRAVLLAPLRPAFIGFSLASIILSIAAGTFLAWRATKPLRAVSDTTQRILSTGDFKARVPETGASGELAMLVQQLNTLLDRNAAHFGVLRETLDNLAHDLRTPLTRLRGTAELALQKRDNAAEAREALADCIEQSDRVLHLLETLLDVSAAEAGALKLNRDRIDLRTLVEHAVDLYKEVAEEKGISFFVQLTAVDAEVDAVRLGQALNNLVDNALKYTPAGGRVTIGAGAEGNFALLTVEDNGSGVPPGEREKIWRRLYRSDSSRSQRGLGLGLSMVKAIVEAHGGAATVGDAPGGGARFTIRVPLSASGAPPRTA